MNQCLAWSIVMGVDTWGGRDWILQDPETENGSLLSEIHWCLASYASYQTLGALKFVYSNDQNNYYDNVTCDTFNNSVIVPKSPVIEYKGCTVESWWVVKTSGFKLRFEDGTTLTIGTCISSRTDWYAGDTGWLAA